MVDVTKHIKHHVKHRGGAANEVVDDIPQLANGAPSFRPNSNSANTQNLADGAVDAVKNSGEQAANQEPSILQKMGGVTGAAFLFVPMLPVVASGATGAVSKIGEWTGSQGLREWGTNAKLTVKTMSEKTIAEVFKGSKTAQLVGKNANKVTNAIGGGVEAVTEKTKAGGFFARVPAWRADANYNKLKVRLNGADAIVADLPTSVRPHADEMLKHLQSTSHVSHINADKMGASAKSFGDAADAVEKATKAERVALKSFGKIISTAESAAGNHVNAQGLRNIGGMVKELPSSIGKSAVIPGAMNTAFIGMSGVGMYSVATDFSSNVASLKEMTTDITGKKVSILGLFTGHVPKPVADARSKLLLNFGIAEVSGAAGLVVSIMSAARGKIGALGFIAPQIAGMAGNAIVGESAVSYYKGMKDAHAAGQKLAAGDYALLIGNSSPELKARGGEGSPFTKTLAEMYAQQNISPKQVMQEIDNGDLKKRVALLIKENEAAHHASTPTKSHVAALTEPTAKVVMPKKELEVVGDGHHTSRVVADASRAQQAVDANQAVLGGV